MKKQIVLLSLFAITLAGCGTPSTPKENNTYTFKFKNVRQDLDNFNLVTYVKSRPDQITLNFNDFVTSDNTKFNKSIAVFDNIALTATYDIYTNIYPYNEETGEYEVPSAEEQYSTVLKAFHFEDIELFDLSQETYEEDAKDVCRAAVGHHDFTYDKKEYQVFFIMFYGTWYPQEWKSNFDLGYPNDNYITEDHPRSEWVHQLQHKGFDIASNRTYTKFARYVNAHRKDNATLIYNATGHSRGGSIVNLFVKNFKDQLGGKMFGYAFAPSGCTRELNNLEVPGLFTLINNEDFIPAIPNVNNGFGYYGTIIRKNCSIYKDEFNEYFEGKYVYSGAFPEGTSLFAGKYLGNVKDAYVDPVKQEEPLIYDTLVDAEAAYLSHSAVAESVNADYNYCVSFDRPVYNEEDEKYEMYYSVSPTLYLNVLQMVFDGAILDILVLRDILSEFFEDFIGAAAITLANGIFSFLKSHLLASYYFMALHYGE